MKRVYITAVPLASNFILRPEPVQCVNIDLSTDEKILYPITRLIGATREPDDQVVVMAVRQVNDPENINFDHLKEEIGALAGKYELIDITIPETQQKDFLMDLFRDLTGALEEDCTVYADATFGTKTYPLVLFSALNYAVKIKECEVERIIYQEQKRDKITHKAISTKIYDVTSLFLLDQVVNTLGFSDAGPEEKKALLETLMQL